MKAVVIKEFNKDFVIEDVAVPRIGEHDALVKVKASCLCAADGKIRDGRMPSLALPHIPGHEVAGEVVEIGKRVRNVKVGDRVVVYMYTVCGDCYACRDGRENLCVNIVRLGLERQGGHAEFVAVPERQLLHLPEAISYEHGAAIPDAVSTSLHAIRDQGQVKLNDYVVILGVGGLGMQALQIARLCGARVIAVARSEDKLSFAKQIGAEWTFNGRDEHLAQQIVEVTEGRGADVVVEMVGTPQTFQCSVDCLKKGGSIVVVGSTAAEIAFTVGKVMFKEIAIKGSLGMTKQTVVDAIDLCRSGRLKPVVTDRYPLEGINDAARRLSQGKVIGRSVLIP
jgi:2-desacetyl-2-hydroxyethyl bacteriochlorophyllide A dehydrogenase